MKIFIIGAKCSPDTMESHVINACEELSWEVSYFDNRSLFGTHSKIDKAIRHGASLFLREPERLKEKNLVNNIVTEKPDLILVILGSHLSPKTIKKIKGEISVPIVCWCQDALSNLKRQYILSGEYDFVFLKDRYMVDLFGSMVGAEFKYLPEACNPNVHFHEKPSDNERSKYECDITTAASLYYYRQSILKKLDHYDLKVWGAVPDWLDYQLNVKHMNEYVVGREKRLAFSSSKIVLNTLHYAEIQGVNCRLFEVAGCGGFQIVSYKDCLEEYFELGVEIETFKNIDELVEKIEYYIDKPDLRDEMAKRSMDKAHELHNFKRRIETIVSYL